MDTEISPALDRIQESTRQLLTSAAGLTDAQAAGASRLPGWTRGHVLTHLARNADGFVNLLAWARTGVKTPMYPSEAARDAGIEAGPAGLLPSSPRTCAAARPRSRRRPPG